MRLFPGVMLISICIGCSIGGPAPVAKTATTDSAKLTTEVTVPVKSPEAIAITSFEKLVNDIRKRAAVTKKYVAVAPPSAVPDIKGKWGREEESWEIVSYDIKKTDSIYAPLQGIIRVKRNKRVAASESQTFYRFDSREEAINTTEFGSEDSKTFSREYNWEGGVWVPQRNMPYPYLEKPTFNESESNYEVIP